MYVVHFFGLQLDVTLKPFMSETCMTMQKKHLDKPNNPSSMNKDLILNYLSSIVQKAHHLSIALDIFCPKNGCNLSTLYT